DAVDLLCVALRVPFPRLPRRCSVSGSHRHPPQIRSLPATRCPARLSSLGAGTADGTSTAETCHLPLGQRPARHYPTVLENTSSRGVSSTEEKVIVSG